MRARAPQRSTPKPLQGSNQFRSSCGRPTHRCPRRQFRHARRHRRSGATCRHWSGRFGHYHRSGANYIHAANTRPGQRSPNGDRTNTNSVASSGLALSVGPPFSLVQNTCNTSLASGASCSTGVVFTPTANGVVTGALTVSSTAFVIAATASLTGIGGAAGSVQVQPASLSFTATGVGGTSATQNVILTNNGAITLAGLTLLT